MQSQNLVEINFAQRSKVPELIGDTKFGIAGENYRRKCPFKPCNKPGCRKFWHKPATAYNPGFVRQLRPMILVVGVMEIMFGVVLIATMETFSDKYNRIYGTEGSKFIRLSSIFGVTNLMLCGAMLLVSLVKDNRKLMWIRIMICTGLSGYVIILSVPKMHFALLAIEKDPSLSNNHPFLLSDACMLEIFTLLGTVVHFFGDVAVFTYYNLRFLHPTLFYTGQVENL